MSEEETVDVDEETEQQRIKDEREKIKKLGLEEKSKESFSVLTKVNNARKHHEKVRKKKFVGFEEKSE